MCKQKRFNKKKQLIGYRFFCWGKDPKTGLNKLYPKVFKIPSEILDDPSAIKTWKKKTEREYEDYIEELSKGIVEMTPIVNENVKFIPYAEEWAERILIKNPESYSYYNQAIHAINIFKEKFPVTFLIRNLNPTNIQKFYDWLCTRTYTKNTITVKKSVQELIKNKKLKVKNVSADCGFSRITLQFAKKVGHQINRKTADKICKYFNIKFEDFFDIKTEQVKYSRASNTGVRRILVTVLADAKRKKIIKENYGTKEYTDPITGATREKEIYTEEESTEFVLKVMNETDIRKKTVFSIMIFLGLRSSEVCGLEWCDINFDDKELTVRQVHSYFGKKFKGQTKAPKSKSSTRTIAMPDQLVEILLEYKKWWDEKKTLFGDLWADTDFLFVRDNGKTRTGGVHGAWLKQAQLEYGMKNVPPHSLRHTNITMQLMAGVPIKTISERAGHKDSAITLNTYSHFLKKSDKEAAQQINQMFCKKLTSKEAVANEDKTDKE